MTLTVNDKHLSSETLTCSVQRHPGESKPVLLYLYEHVVKRTLDRYSMPTKEENEAVKKTNDY